MLLSKIKESKDILDNKENEILNISEDIEKKAKSDLEEFAKKLQAQQDQWKLEAQ